MLELIIALVGIASSLIKWWERKQLIDAGRAQAALEGLEKASAELELAKKARLDQRRANDADPSGGMSSDKFERKDD